MKPTAWIREDGVVAFHEKKEVDSQGYKWHPLYTHPVKELDEQFKKGFEAGKEEGWKAHKFHHSVKELTDEEIAELSDKILCYQIYDNKESGVFEFARAILRKAQEK